MADVVERLEASHLVAGLLVGLHVGLPPLVRDQLAFDHEAFVPWTLLTSAYVHHSVNHLLNNAVGFLIAASVVYWLCWLLSMRRWFRVTVVSFLIVLPVLVNLTSYVVLGWVVPDASPIGRGFSGVVAGNAGFLFIAFVAWVAQQSSRGVAVFIGEGVGVLMAFVLALIHSGLELSVLGLTGVGIGLSGWGLSRESEESQVHAQWREWLPELGAGIGVVLILLWFLVALFPPEFVGSEMTTNIFADGAGFVWGAKLAVVVNKLKILYKIVEIRK
jgi:hypothetical protein